MASGLSVYWALDKNYGVWWKYAGCASREQSKLGMGATWYRWIERGIKADKHRMNRFMAASKVLGEETIAGSAAGQGQGQSQRGQGGSET